MQLIRTAAQLHKKYNIPLRIGRVRLLRFTAKADINVRVIYRGETETLYLRKSFAIR